ncbi:MAG: DUF2723 domain-containing protein [Kiritimatiellae bacterium]|nr:DUF2723 domain-containing protein [Kiritimatiellia bacterium]
MKTRAHRFFRGSDWVAFGVTTAAAFGVYLCTLAPTVTLEDSGELIVAAAHLGVPHPPGYPIWTLLGWCFQKLFGFATYRGYPNPAWGVNLMSAFFGALAGGLTAMLVSHSGATLFCPQRAIETPPGQAGAKTLCACCGVACGLLLAFTPALWSQSVIAEVYSLNAFFLLLLLLLTYRWMMRPERTKPLYLAAFLFGLGMTNHQPLVLLLPALGLVVLLKAPRVCRDTAIAGSILLFFVRAARFSGETPQTWTWLYAGLAPSVAALALVLVFMRGSRLYAATFLAVVLMFAWLVRQGVIPAVQHPRTWLFAGYLLMAVLVLVASYRMLPNGPTATRLILMIVAGLAVYLYLPLASSHNPPMNWGYPRTWTGFKHAITRGQYPRLTPAQLFSRTFLSQLGLYLADLRRQFTRPVAVLALAPLLVWLRSIVFPFRRNALGRWAFAGLPHAGAAGWPTVTVLAFAGLSLGLLVVVNPRPDLQSQFINRVFFIPSHAVCAIWAGYGLLLCLRAADAWATRAHRAAPWVGRAAVLFLPLCPLLNNAFNANLVRDVGGAEQNGHDFGWQFGHYSLGGAPAIAAELGPAVEPLPNPSYPPPMEPAAVFFGGTDPGRFVPTYQIFCPKDRPDVYLITQNALADATYTNVMRDLYGDAIWIPSAVDSNRAFQVYLNGVREGRFPPTPNIRVQNGKVSVQGQQEVMHVNGILARMIFERNKARHAFYVEESYPIGWMYPHLVPHGLVMRLNPDPLRRLPHEAVRNDREFWDWYVRRLLKNNRFRRDLVARKTFSKLRTAIAGLYVYRRLYAEAEYAYRQATRLCPGFPEPTMRLADLYMRQRRFDEAGSLLEELLTADPHNAGARECRARVRESAALASRRRVIEREAAAHGGRLSQDLALELAEICVRTGSRPAFLEPLARRLLAATNPPPGVLLRVARLCGGRNDLDLAEQAYAAYLRHAPRDADAWYELAVIRTALGRTDDACTALRRAVMLGGQPMRERAGRDPRFRVRRGQEATWWQG